MDAHPPPPPPPGVLPRTVTQQMDDDDDDASEWYDSFGESYDDGPPGSPGAAGADSDSWKSRTFGKPGAPEEAGGRAEEELLERLRSKEQLLELETTAKGQLAAQLAAALAAGATREQELLRVSELGVPGSLPRHFLPAPPTRRSSRRHPG